jgi:hypothetical protein
MSGNHALLLTRMSSRLHELFDGRINLSDVEKKQPVDKENFFLTRSLAALSLMDDADLSPDQAALCVTDGGEDDGIDAVYVDEKKKIVYFVQSKWRHGTKGVQLNDFTRFRDGVKGVIQLKWTAENANQSRSRNSAQGDKWNFCLTAGTLCLRIRSDHEQTSTPEPHSGLQGKGGACRRQG